ncbi:MAG: twin-arginine translocation signal domain-containing protein [Nanoarchaeota archaeon]
MEISRRQFLRTAGLAAVAAVSPTFPKRLESPDDDRTIGQFQQEFNQATQAGISRRDARELYTVFQGPRLGYNSAFVSAALEYVSSEQNTLNAGQEVNPRVIVCEMASYHSCRGCARAA